MARVPRLALTSIARPRRLVEHHAVRERLVSVSGLVGRPIRLEDGAHIGRVLDLVVHVGADRYPPVRGVVARVGRRRAYLPMTDVVRLGPGHVVLGSPRLDVRDFERRADEALLMGDLVDHQLVDIDGLRVVRASDLYLARLGDVVRLVGVDVGVGPLLRRLGPARWRERPSPERVIDWADIEWLGGHDGVRLERPKGELRRLRPGDLADLIEALSPPQQDQLVEVLDVAQAADALEEMDERHRDAVLRRLDPDRVVAILASMEPDEAAEVLRRLEADRRDEIVDRLPDDAQTKVQAVLSHGEGTAGGIMTTVVVTATADETVATVLDRLRELREHRADIDAVLVVDGDGVLLDDVAVFDLALASRETSMRTLLAASGPVVVAAETPVDDVVDAVLSSRRGSVVVADPEGRPIGRVLADDLLDSLGTRWARLGRAARDRSAP